MENKAEFSAFEQHKKTLLDILRKVHRDGPKSSEPFDEDTAWGLLKRSALTYLRRPEIEQKTMLPARCRERLRDLAKALGRARREAHKAMQDDVQYDLLRGWYAEANIPPAVAIQNAGSGDVMAPMVNQFKLMMAGLTALEAAASRAARDMPTKTGPRRGTGILPMHDLMSLQAVYQRSTGIFPRMGAGPFFVEFVEEFLTAVGRGADIVNDYVAETLKYERRRARKNSGR